MAFIAKDVVVWDGDDEGHNFNIPAHGSSLAGDLLLVIAAFPSSFLTTYQTVPPSSNTVLKDQAKITAKSSDGLFEQVLVGQHQNIFGGHLQIFKRIYDVADVNYGFSVDMEFPNGDTTEDSFPNRFGYFSMLIYRTVNNAAPIETFKHFYVTGGGSGSQNLVVTKTDTTLLQVSLGISHHPSAPTGDTGGVTLDAAFTSVDERFSGVADPVETIKTDLVFQASDTDYYKYHFNVGDRFVAAEGNYDITFDQEYDDGTNIHTSQFGYHAYLALTDASHSPPDTPDSGDGPDKAGVGYMVWESENVKPLSWELWSVDDDTGDLSQELDSSSTTPCLGATLYYDGMGGCSKGEAFFPLDPTGSRHDTVFRFLIDEPSLTTPAYYYTALAHNSRRDGNRWTVELVDLLDVIIDGPVGAILAVDPPSLAGVFPEATAVELFRGKLPAINAATEDEFQSWRELLKRRFDAWQVFYGVTSNLKYVQGRVGDANHINIDYSANKHRMEMEIERSTKNDYATDAWVIDGTSTLVTIDRNDVKPLTIRKVVKASLDGNGDVVTPPGIDANFFEEQGRKFVIYGLVKPPAKIIGIPQIGEQHVVSSRVEILPSTANNAPRIVSTVITVALPRVRD